MKKLFLLLFVLLPTLAFAELVPIRHKNGKWGYKESRYYIDKFVIKPKFEAAHRFVGDYAFVCQKGLWGIIGQDGKFVVAPKYSSASAPYRGVTIVGLDGKFGLARGATELTAICYDHIKCSTKGNYFFAQSNGKYGLLDGQIGILLCEIKYDDIQIYDYETFLVKVNGKCGLLNKHGQLIAAEIYDDIQKYERETFLIKTNGKCGLLSKEGKYIVPAQYNSIEEVSSNNFLATLNDYTALFNAQGKIIVEQNCRLVDVKNGILASLSDDGWLFFDTEGKQVSMPNNVILYTTTDGRAVVMYEWHNGYCSKALMTLFKNSYCDGYGILVADNDISEIKENTFRELDNLKSIQLPKTVTSIGKGAFEGCSSLTNFIIPDSVTSIGDAAFKDCSGFTSITIPDGVISIGYLAFDDCKNLTTITIPNSITKIGYAAFQNCWMLASIAIPQGVTTIESHTFFNCYSLTNVSLPNSITSIGYAAFNDCKSLASITIPDSVTKIASGAFENCTSITSVIIPNSVTEIGGSAFENCDALEEVTIGEKVSKIGSRAFYHCKSLKNVYCKALLAPDLGSSDVFLYSSNSWLDSERMKCNIYVPTKTLHIYKGRWSMYESRIYGYDF